MSLWRRSTRAASSTPTVRFAVLAALALVVAFAGSAGAAVLVTGRQIKDGSVAGRDVHAGTVRAADIRDGSLTARDFVGGSVLGPTGAKGDPGPLGPTGPPGLSGLEYVMAPSIVDPASSAFWTATCATPGKVAIAGGGTSDHPFSTALEDSAPTDAHDGWGVTMRNAHPSEQMTGQAWVICATTR